MDFLCDLFNVSHNELVQMSTKTVVDKLRGIWQSLESLPAESIQQKT